MDANMPMTDAAGRLQRNGLAGGAMAMLILVLGPLTAGNHGFPGSLVWLGLLITCLLSLIFSVHLLFDAALFRLAASYDAKDAGLAAIDDVLTRMGFRAADRATKSLPARLTGCHRLLWRQRISLIGGILLYSLTTGF